MNSICIFRENKEQYKSWIQQRFKVKGAFTNIKPIGEALKQSAYQCDRNSVGLSFFKSTDEVSKTLSMNLINPSCIHKYWRKFDLQLTMHKFTLMVFLYTVAPNSLGTRLDLRRLTNSKKNAVVTNLFGGVPAAASFLSMLNKALRTVEVDLTIHIGFFVRNVPEKIARLHSAPYRGEKHLKSFTVFSGQDLSQAYILNNS